MRLALKSPKDFQHILAVTFTNKATEEMKSRIVETLQSISKENHPLSNELQDALGLNADKLKIRAEEVLRNILHQYNSFAVCTIDAFFQKVVRTFAREIGVQGGFQVELDQNKVISDSVDKLLLEVGQDKKLTDWLTDFAIYNITEGNKWDSKNDIKSLSNELFKELFIQKKHLIFEKLEDVDFTQSYIKKLDEIKTSFESDMMNFGNQALGIMKVHNLQIEDFTQGQRGVGSYFLKLANKEISEPNSYVFKALNDNSWYAKKSEKKDEIEAALSAGLYSCLEEILNYQEQNYSKYFTTINIIKNIYALGILSKVNQYLLQYRDENDTLLISDFPVFLNQIINDSDTPYIYEKIGSKYKNYLIDEFQDTSGLQWNNFRPLLQDSIASDNFNMIVGDIKQSIYRWRGGNWKLLLDGVQEQIGDDKIINEKLNINWRSRRNVIDFNNGLFEATPSILYEQLNNASTANIKGIESIKNAYSDAYQQVADKDNVEGGLVTAKFFDSKSEEFDEQSMSLMIEKIEQLQTAKYKLKDIAILVRTAREGKKVTDALMEYEQSNPESKYQYDIISNESLYLKNAPEVNLIIQSLNYILEPEESLHKAQLNYAYNWHFNDSIGLENNVEYKLRTNLESLANLALTDLVEELCRILELGKNKNELAYLLAFQDAVLDYSKNKNAGIEGFLFWWEDNSQRAIQVSENQEGMKLMTIHKSKGLQFKTVIIPFCTWNVDHDTRGNKQNILWCDTADKENFDELPYLPLKYSGNMQKTLFASEYWEEKSKAYLDNLNLLYVAFTRAEEVLHVIGQKPKSIKDISNVSSLLFKHLSKLGDNWNAELFEYDLGEVVDFTIYEEDKEFQELPLENYITQPWNKRKELQAKQHDFWYDENVKASIDEGNIMHWILSKIKSINGLENAMKHAKIEFGLSDDLNDSIYDKLEQFLSADQVKNWFVEGAVVKNEMDIIDPKGKVMRPDRVIINEEEVIVIDFKTGSEQEFHKKQVRTYKELIENMGYENVVGYLLYINQGKVVDVA